MSLKINNLEIENVKRVKAVRLEPTPNGLTVIGGKNGQGKTSVLDAIAWALGGDKFRPSTPDRDGSMVPPALKITLSNGLVVERSGKNSTLKVTDPQGNKGGQQLLNEFVEQLALDLPRFMAATSKEKAATLLRIIGVEDELRTLETKAQQLYNRRTEIGRIADQKQKFVAELAHYPDAPAEPVSAAELIKRQQDILARNSENVMKRHNLKNITEKVNNLHNQITELQRQLQVAETDQQIALKSAADLQDESTAELEQSLANIEAINAKVRANMDREKAALEADDYSGQYDGLTAEINQVRQEITALLNGANLPLPELSVENGELLYRKFAWDNMSGSDQLKVATAIVRRLNPKCGFVLMDKLEQMDADTMREFGSWLEAEGLQVIATRVSTSQDECTIIISDGYAEEGAEKKSTWERGKF